MVVLNKLWYFQEYHSMHLKNTVVAWYFVVVMHHNFSNWKYMTNIFGGVLDEIIDL